jgi:arginase
MSGAEHVNLIGIPMDLGANRRGVDMGPSAIRYAGLQERIRELGLEVSDSGDVHVPFADECDPESEDPDCRGARYLDETKDACVDLRERVRRVLDRGQFPIVLGGDHSLSIGSVGGSAADVDDLGLIWFDAHGDINTPENSPSGNLHGMPLAALFGYGSFKGKEWAHEPSLQEQNLVYVGLRRLDAGEKEVISDSEITAFTMRDIDRTNIGAVVEQALEVATVGTEAIHVSLDMDWVNPTEAPGVGTPVPGGVTYREAHLAMETIAQRNLEDSVVRSMDLVEVNPILDEQNRTAELACELAASLLGKSVL